MLLTGTAETDAGVDFVWIAIRDLMNDRFWTGDQWQSAYTRFKINPKNRGAQTSDWSYEFQPPATGTYQAFARAVDLDGGWDPTSAQVWFRIDRVNVAQEPETTIRQDIRGQTLSGSVNLYGTASAGNIVDFVWLAVHDIGRDQWWTGSAWQDGYTRFILHPLTANATQTDWSYDFSPGRTGDYQAHARAIDDTGGFDPTAAEVWFKIR
ncbi:MAG: hypothetical protein ABFS02_12070 [Pseudomonadota bacterium]